MQIICTSFSFFSGKMGQTTKVSCQGWLLQTKNPIFEDQWELFIKQSDFLFFFFENNYLEQHSCFSLPNQQTNNSEDARRWNIYDLCECIGLLATTLVPHGGVLPSGLSCPCESRALFAWRSHAWELTVWYRFLYWGSIGGFSAVYTKNVHFYFIYIMLLRPMFWVRFTIFLSANEVSAF